MPTLEDVLPQLNGAKFFSLCDAKEGFYHIPLAKESTDLKTFWTPIGKYKYLKPPFRIASASEEFQRELMENLAGLNGITVVADDILIFERTRKEHDSNLEALLKRARQTGPKLNKEKSCFLQDELLYIGHIHWTNGLKPDPNKVNAILKMKPPSSLQGVEQFLGHINYM